nr:PREDICTED: uncharacterized protein LOC109039375 [Bemisia tabaci]XP_018910385.1 PREDICTED: uncharacterized protein LOC109039375 [Bemisia tabaci]XP_018910386.1 PREDICTED: uncharacterized protein LOC109039375 [Bemisia tabaci]XP_018910387.1 PREDICTED: uncharacterized protein LOC109039375 [Bemisia tabaci]XP_018910388.1 PREDICTED: uncharacterized protein LOC109039375 [Bemisia tabaci]
MEADDVKLNYFNVLLCQVCKSKESFENSKHCSGCGLISYCSKAHQKLDWKSHKEICRAAQTVCDIVGELDVFYCGERILSAQQLIDRVYHRKVCDFPPKSDKTKIKMTVTQMIEKNLGRKPKQFEMLMMYFPKRCATCFIGPDENLKKELVCKKCFSVIFCSEQCQNMNKHELICSDFQKVLDVDLFMLNVNVDTPQIQLLKPTQATKLKLENYDMHSFIAEYIKPDLKFEEEVLVSFYYTCVLTLASMINRIENFKFGGKLTVHVVGAHCRFEERVAKYWETLLHLYPSLRALTVVHIGKCISDHRTNLKLCEDCNSANKSVNCIFRQEVYHDYALSGACMKPDIIIAYNSGIYDFDEQYDPWGASLPYFLQNQNVPFILTENFKYEIVADLKRLFQTAAMLGKNIRIVVNCEKNPFSDLRLYRDWDAEDSFRARNGFVSAVIAK